MKILRWFKEFIKLLFIDKPLTPKQIDSIIFKAILLKK